MSSARLSPINRPDAVVAAAYTAVDRLIVTRLASPSSTPILRRTIARAAANLSVPTVHLSTDYAFDGAKGWILRGADPVGPLGTYGLVVRPLHPARRQAFENRLGKAVPSRLCRTGELVGAPWPSRR